MNGIWHRARQQWRQVRAEAKTPRMAWRFVGEYVGLRLWTLIISCFPVDANLVTAKWMGRAWWWLMKRHRVRALENLRPALGHKYSEAELTEIARRSFEHFAQLYLVEFMMTPRLVTKWSWSRYLSLGNVGPALREMLRGRGVLMITPHFGNFELMGFTIARLGLPLTAIMRPLPNPLLNPHLVESRARGGLRLLFKRGAMESAGDVIERGGALCFIADQDAGRKGIFADFFHRRASWYKSIGLLAMHYRVPIVVGAATRRRAGFHYALEVERIIQPEEWDGRDDPLQWITDTYASAMETMIERHPEQYLWVHRRWKTRPKDEWPSVGE